VGRADLRLRATGGPIRVIGVVPGQLLTEHLVLEPTVRDGVLVADRDRDLAKVAVVERHHATGRVGVGFVRGFGLRTGAFATTVAHDAHNIVVVGVADDDMALCVARLGEIGGGIVVVADRQTRAELPLPIAGLLSDRPAEEVVAAMDELHRVVEALGVTAPSPFMTLSFLALSVIPSLKITDRGLIDVDRFAVVPVEVDAEQAP
jgi:adenine deaminase